ncbi:MAG: class I SAM-dependent methyltransferase [Planctomycetes bacterium]|nr:class I SAM-dependent methyltransferase [Planctomycetota bacterium]
MSWARLLGSAVSSAPLPRAVVRHLLFTHQIGMGSRVLVVGCGHGELVHFFDDLGMDAGGLDESPDNVDWAAEHEPRSDFRLVSSPAEASLEYIRNDEPYNLIVVRHLTTYNGNLFCPSSFLATAKLLQNLRPNGWFTFLVHRDNSRPSNCEAHEVSCFTRHLSFFPGTCRVSRFADCELSTIANDWLHLHRHHGEFVVVSLRIPHVALSATEWRRLAIQAAESQVHSCCSWAASQELTYQPALAKRAG